MLIFLRMSKEKATGHLASLNQPGGRIDPAAQSTTQTPGRPPSRPQEEDLPVASDTTSSGIPSPGTPGDEQKPSAKEASSSESGARVADDPNRPRQVIAVSASRGPAAFFNLARKFLVTDDMCDLSALEGAIVSAVDAAHLLERSKLATIVRVQTSYVTVEPKRRKQHTTGQEDPRQRVDAGLSSVAAASQGEGSPDQPTQGSSRQRGSGAASGRELRRARIVITVQRTHDYERWLEENPLQAIIAGDGDDVVAGAEAGSGAT